MSAKKCICQICTCGRHRCPNEKHHSNVMISEKTDGLLEPSAYHEEFSAKKAERTLPTKPEENLKISSTAETTEKCSVTKDMYRAYEKEEAKKSRQNPIRKVDNLRRMSGKIDGTTTNKVMFQKRETSASGSSSWQLRSRSDLTAEAVRNRQRAQTSHVDQSLKSADQSQSITSYKNTFTGRMSIGERVTPVKPKNQMDAASGAVSSSTEHKDQFSGKKGDRYEAKKPMDQIRKTSGQFQSVTSSKAAFVSNAKGERFALKKPKDNISKGEGSLDGTTFYKEAYKSKNVERPKMTKPKDSYRKASGKFDGSTINSQTFVIAKGERYDVQKPKSTLGLASPDEHFDGKTVNRETFVVTKGERMPVKIPQDTLKTSKDTMEYKTVQKEAFTGAATERTKAVIHADTYPKPEGPILASTVNMETYKETKADRLPVKIPLDNLHNSTDIVDYTTMNKQIFTGKAAERVTPARPADSYIKPQGNFETSTVSRETYVNTVGDRLPMKIPKDNIDAPSGDFEARTEQRDQFQAITTLLQRQPPVKPVESFTTAQGPFDGTTMHKVEFQDVKAERPTMIRHPDNISNFHGSLDSLTTQRNDFHEVRIQRVQPVVPVDSYPKPVGPMEMDTMHRSEFKEVKAERVPMVKHPDNLERLDGLVDYSTTQKQDYHDVEVERPSPVIPLDSFPKADGPFDAMTMHRAEFKEVKGERAPVVKHEDGIPKLDGSFDSLTTQKRDFHEILGYDRPTSIKPTELIQKADGSFDATTVNKIEFKEVRAERPTPIKHADNLQNFGAFNSSTTQKHDFTGTSVARPPSAKPLESIVTSDTPFDATTVHRSEFKELKGDKVTTMKRPDNIQPNEGQFDDTTTQRKDFHGSRGDRALPIRPVEALQRPEGHFDASTVHKEVYRPVKGERMPKVRHLDTLHNEGTMDFTTVHDSAFKECNGDRVPVKKPVDNLRNASGSLDTMTMSKQHYTGASAEKVSPVRPHDMMPKIDGKFDGTTTNRELFIEVIGDRAPVVIAQDSIERPSGPMDTTTVHRITYKDIDVHDRVLPVKHEDNVKSLGHDDRFDHTSTNSVDFREVGRCAPSPVIPKDTFPKSEGTMELQTTQKEAFRDVKSQRPQIVKHADNVKSLGHDEKFRFTTSHGEEYNILQVEQRLPIRPKDMFPKTEGTFEQVTTQKEAFTEVKGEKFPMVKRADNVESLGFDDRFYFDSTNRETYRSLESLDKVTPIRPKDSYSKFEGEFDHRTTQMENFYEIKGDRLPMVKHTEDRVLQYKDSPLDNLTVHKEEFRYFDRGERFDIQRREATLKPENVPFEGQTTQRQEYRSFGDVDRSTLVKPKENYPLKMEGPFEDKTMHKEQFRFYDKIDRSAPKVPKDHLTRFGDDSKFSSATVHRQTFQDISPGVSRSTPVLPQDTFPKNEGSFDDRTVHKTDYAGLNSPIERPKAVLPHNNLHIDPNAAFTYDTVHRNAFRPHTSVEKTVAVRPTVSHRQTFVNDSAASFESTTVYKQNFQEKDYSKLSPVRPLNDPNLIIDKNGNFAEFASSKSHGAYSKPLAKGERYEIKKPTDNLGRSTSKMVVSTSYHDSFAGEGQDSGRRTGRSTSAYSRNEKDGYSNQAYGRSTPIKPAHQIAPLTGPMDFSTVYSKDFMEKAGQQQPCIAGHLLESTKNAAVVDMVVKNFKFSHDDHGHKYFSPV